MTTTSGPLRAASAVPAPRSSEPGSAEAPDAVLGRIDEGTSLAERGEVARARSVLQETWDEIGEHGGARYRWRAAQALGWLQDDPSLALRWHLRALLAADQVEDAHAGDAGTAAAYPALHLDVAEAHRRLGDREPALRHLQLGRCALLALPDDPAREAAAGAFDALEAQLR